jgi:type II secretory pathway pseudopilin PulG
MRSDPHKTRTLKSRNSAAFTLMEVMMSIVILAAVFATTIMAYTQVARRAEWTGYSLAAHALAIQQIEQARAASWDPSATSGDQANQITNLTLLNKSFTPGANWRLTGYSWANLDLPTKGNNFVRATNFVTIQAISIVSTRVQVTMVRVDSVWPFKGQALYTNTIITYCAPDNGETPN